MPRWSTTIADSVGLSLLTSNKNQLGAHCAEHHSVVCIVQSADKQHLHLHTFMGYDTAKATNSCLTQPATMPCTKSGCSHQFPCHQVATSCPPVAHEHGTDVQTLAVSSTCTMRCSFGSSLALICLHNFQQMQVSEDNTQYTVCLRASSPTSGTAPTTINIE